MDCEGERANWGMLDKLHIHGAKQHVRLRVLPRRPPDDEDIGRPTSGDWMPPFRTRGTAATHRGPSHLFRGCSAQLSSILLFLPSTIIGTAAAARREQEGGETGIHRLALSGMAYFIVNTGSGTIHRADSRDSRCQLARITEERRFYCATLEEALHLPGLGRLQTKSCRHCLPHGRR